LIITNTERIWK